MRASARTGSGGAAGAGGADLCHDDPLARRDGRLADRAGSDPGGHGGDLGLLEAGVYLLEAAGFDSWLVNARDVKHLPGRPKTDKLDAVWLCKVAERQMVRPSFVPPAPIRELRDLTRYRVDLLGERGREKNRVEKLLEDAGINLSVVASDIFGVSGQAMMDALVAGERDPKVLASMARTRMRGKTVRLQEAFIGRFGDHHAFLLARMLAHVDAINADIAAVEHRIEELIGPFAAAAAHLDEIPGVGATAAHRSSPRSG
ncbi:MAG: IS110 family transposase [Mycobacterium leprae]